MTGALEIRSLFIGLLFACAGCIGAPPGSADRADAGETNNHSLDMGPVDSDGGPDGLDARNNYDGSVPTSDASPDAASDTGTDAPDQPDAGPPGYVPLPVYNIGMVLNPAHTGGVSDDTQALLLHLTAGLNAGITYGHPNALASGNHDLLWVPHEAGQHFAESTIAILASLDRPILATRTAAWPPLNFANGAESPVYAATVEVVEPLPVPALFVGVGPLQIYQSAQATMDRPGLGAGVMPVAVNQAGKPTVFVYEQSAEMALDPAGGTTPSAPARRVGFAPDVYMEFTANGWDLLDGAVLWALSDPIAPMLDCHILTEQTAARSTMLLRSRMRLHGCIVQILDSTSEGLATSDLVVVLPDAAARVAIGTALAELASPVLVLWNREEALEAMGLVAEDSVASTTTTDSWVILPPREERLRSARTGVVQVSLDQASYPTLPLNTAVGSSSLIVGHAFGDNHAVTYWAYDKGMQMQGRTAPARRVAMASPQAAVPTREALELLDGAIQWLLDQ